MPTLVGVAGTSAWHGVGANYPVPVPAGTDPTDVVIVVAIADGDAPSMGIAGFTTLAYRYDDPNSPFSMWVGVGTASGSTVTVVPGASVSIIAGISATFAAEDTDPTILVGTPVSGDPSNIPVVPGVNVARDGSVGLLPAGQAWATMSGATTTPAMTLARADGSAALFSRPLDSGLSGDVTITPPGAWETTIAVQLVVQPPAGGPDPDPPYVVEIYDGTTWQPAVVEVYDGSAWQPASAEIT